MTQPDQHFSRTRSIGLLLALLALVLLGTGCGGRRSTSTSAAPLETPERLLQQSDVWVVEAGGTPPDDTTLTVETGRNRILVLRNGAPDQATFAVLNFPDSAFGKAPGGTVSVTVRVRPGVYGLDIECPSAPVGARITFNYARHFEAPVAAVKKYGTGFAFEREVVVGRLNDDGSILMLRTRRPNPDNVSAPLTQSGSYVVAGPR